jgi:hypothetical protein
MNDILEAIGASAIGTFMAESATAFPWVESVHVAAITTVIGVIAIVDLRLIGVASKSYSVSRLTKALLPLTWVGFALAVVTGLLLFASQPVTYFNNFAFRMKMVLLVAAGLNMVVFHLITMRGIALWDRDAPVPGAAKAAGVLSIIIWVLIVVCGRWIGFTSAPF